MIYVVQNHKSVGTVLGKMSLQGDHLFVEDMEMGGQMGVLDTDEVDWTANLGKFVLVDLDQGQCFQDCRIVEREMAEFHRSGTVWLKNVKISFDSALPA